MRRDNKEDTFRIRITGLVQGVGFRPFVYRLATAHQLQGTVDNRNDGVLIYVSGSSERISRFVSALEREAPTAAVIEKVNVQQVDTVVFSGFHIVKSSNNSIVDEITEISPDIAVCDACLADMKTQPHRIDYPFINCTNCGPRFTIIKALPYDRPLTTMASFVLCAQCEKEYKEVTDRRFHAQPVACNRCGPHYTLQDKNGEISEINELLAKMAELLEKGETIALKGLGGFNLVCDASNEDAVEKLRRSKYRDGKPLAVLFRDIETLRKFAFLSTEEEQLLTLWRRPIVLLRSKKPLAKGVHAGLSTVGALLPYMPFHHLFFEKTNLDAIVYTSANIAGEPILIDNQKALEAFRERTAAVITYNRAIYNRTDDSVAFLANNIPRLIRRSRGYTPSPIRLGFEVDGILSVGAELANTFCIGRTTQAILSQHIGDLKNARTLEFFEESILRYQSLFKFTPKLIVSDLHPDYLSSRYAEEQPVEQLKVQHHHAHMASCMAENRLDEQVIGIVFDGTGLGEDGNIWGGEFFTGDFNTYERVAHFEYLPLPGGDAVTKEPWRTGLSYLYAAFGKAYRTLNIPFVKNLDTYQAHMMTQMIDKNLNSPLSSSAGRLFDAVSAITNLCTKSTFHAEAPMRLEEAVGSCNTEDFYLYSMGKIIDFKPMMKAIVDDITQGESIDRIAAKFHNTLIRIAVDVCRKIRTEKKLNKVVLSGGSFQNRYLSERLERSLKTEGFIPFFHQKVPANDGGLALGQLAIAAKKLNVRQHP